MLPVSFHRCPQWSEDECLATRNVSNEIHCFDGGAPGGWSTRWVVYWVDGALGGWRSEFMAMLPIFATSIRDNILSAHLEEQVVGGQG